MPLFGPPSIEKLWGKRDVSGLIKALNHRDPQVRRDAAEALAQLGDPRAEEALIAALRDEDYGVRTRAAMGLGQVGGSDAVLPLIAALRDLPHEAEGGLSALGDRHGLEPYLDGLVDALDQKDLDGRRDAVVKLRQLVAKRRSRETEFDDPSMVEFLIAALNDEDEEVRAQVAGMLGELGDSRAVRPLIAALQDEGFGVSEAATRALGELGDQRAVEPLIGALRNGTGNVLSIIGALTNATPPLFGDARAVEPLIAALQHEWSQVRTEAAGALGLVMDRRAVEPLIALLGDEDVQVVEAASGALAWLGEEELLDRLTAVLEQGDPQHRQGAATALAEWASRRRSYPPAPANPRAIEALAAAFRKSGLDEARTIALAMIDSSGDEALVEAAGSVDAAGGLREVAVSALDERGLHQAAERVPLMPAQREARQREREAKEVKSLVDILGVESEQGHRAAEKLVAIGAPTVAPLVGTVEGWVFGRYGAGPHGVQRAVYVLGKIRDPRAVDPLIAALMDLRSRYGAAVLQILVAAGPTPYGVLPGEWASNVVDNSGYMDVVVALLNSLAEIGDRRAVAAIVAWDPLADWSPQQRRALLEDRRHPATADSGYAQMWESAKRLTRAWVDALYKLGGAEAHAALRGGTLSKDEIVGAEREETERAASEVAGREALQRFMASAKPSAEEAARVLAWLYDRSPYRGGGFVTREPPAEPVRQIGERLTEHGGFQLMLDAHRLFATLRPAMARNLEMVWDGIGTWGG